MKINQNNYSLNASTLIKKNTEDDIKNCPFCGVDHTFLINQDTVISFFPDNNDLTPVELKVLDHAVKLELFNGEFYETACQQSKNSALSYLFKDLSRIEFMHAKIHKQLGGFDVLPTLHKPDYSRLDSDILLLDEVAKREQHAITFYKKKSKMVTHPMIKKVFKALSEVEKQHEMIALENKENEKNCRL